MGDIPLTKILIAALVGTFIITMAFGTYSSFISINGVTLDEPYASAFSSIGAQYNNFGTLSVNASNQGLVKNIFDFGKSAVSGTVNVFVVGLDAIGSFFDIIPFIGNVLSAIGTAIPGFHAILGLIALLVGLYVAMSYIKSVSNKNEMP